jgi:hypothetical protein
MATRIRKPIVFDEPRSTVVVLYDATSGSVLHGVTVSADEGADDVPPAEAERMARECAEIGEEITKAAALVVANKDFDRNAVLKVDVRGRKLMRTAAAARLPSKKTAAKKKRS